MATEKYIGLGVAGTLTIAGGAIACGGGNAEGPTPDDIKSPTPIARLTDSPMPSQTDPRITPSPTLAPTLEPTLAPTPEPTSVAIEFSPESIFNQPITPADINTIKSFANAFYEAHPEANDMKLVDGSIFPKEYLDNNLNNCEHGDLSDPSLVDVLREAGCLFVVSNMYNLYAENEIQEFFQIARDVRNYFISNYPEKQEKFDLALVDRNVQ
ncbi:MAG: hypothetical protein AAB521_00390 [Patescibacteria group bacterium]